jgi:hypothetical protein
MSTPFNARFGLVANGAGLVSNSSILQAVSNAYQVNSTVFSVNSSLSVSLSGNNLFGNSTYFRVNTAFETNSSQMRLLANLVFANTTYFRVNTAFEAIGSTEVKLLSNAFFMNSSSLTIGTNTTIVNIPGMIAAATTENAIDPIDDFILFFDSSVNALRKTTPTNVVASAVAGVGSFNTRTGSVVPANGDYTAAQITFTPAGGIAASNVQVAIEELDTEKAPKASPVFTGTVTLPTVLLQNSVTVTNTSIIAFANSSNTYDGSTAGASLFKFSDNNFYFDNYDGILIFRRTGSANTFLIHANGQPVFTLTPLVGSTPVALTASPTFTGTTVFQGTVRNEANIAHQNLTFASPIDWNLANAQVVTVTLTGSGTMAAPTNMKVGTYILHVIQGGAGSYTLTWNGVFKWPGGVAPVLSTAVGRRDLFSFVCDGTNMYGSYLPDVR